MVLKNLAAKIAEAKTTPELMAAKSKGDFSHMAVRRALKGRGTDILKAKAIAKVLGCKLQELGAE
jgi:hypothetical protein